MLRIPSVVSSVSRCRKLEFCTLETLLPRRHCAHSNGRTLTRRNGVTLPTIAHITWCFYVLQIPESSAARPSQSHSRIQPRSARFPFHSAEIRTRLGQRKAARVPRNPHFCLFIDDGCLWELRYSEVLRVWHAGTKVHPRSKGDYPKPLVVGPLCY